MKNYTLTIYSNTTGFSQQVDSDSVEVIRGRVENIEDRWCKTIEVFSQKHDSYIYENACGSVRINDLFSFKTDLRSRN